MYALDWRFSKRMHVTSRDSDFQGDRYFQVLCRYGGNENVELRALCETGS